jgi:hypothetical protein
MFTLLASHYCPFPSGPLPSSCTVPSISATVGSTNGTNFLDLCLGQLAAVYYFEEYHGNYALTAEILFLETRDSTRDQSGKDGESQ